jgi:hypothetical protein
MQSICDEVVQLQLGVSPSYLHRHRLQHPAEVVKDVATSTKSAGSTPPCADRPSAA